MLRSLGFLGSLGDGDSGRYGFLLCGSSPSTFDFVCGGYPGLGEVFPLAKGGIPDLNSTKFCVSLVPSCSCTAVGEVAHMLAVLAPPRRAGSRQCVLPLRLSPQARLLTFFVGTSPHAIMRVLLALTVLPSSVVADTAPSSIAA